MDAALTSSGISFDHLVPEERRVCGQDGELAGPAYCGLPAVAVEAYHLERHRAPAGVERLLHATDSAQRAKLKLCVDLDHRHDASFHQIGRLAHQLRDHALPLLLSHV